MKESLRHRLIDKRDERLFGFQKNGLAIVSLTYALAPHNGLDVDLSRRSIDGHLCVGVCRGRLAVRTRRRNESSGLSQPLWRCPGSGRRLRHGTESVYRAGCWFGCSLPACSVRSGALRNCGAQPLRHAGENSAATPPRWSGWAGTRRTMS